MAPGVAAIVQEINPLIERIPMPASLPIVDLLENAKTVLEKRYLRRGEDGRPVETIEEMFWRVAWHIAGPESEQDRPRMAEEFYRLLTSRKFFPNSPTFTGAGTALGQLAACFVLPISDDMGRDEAGIFQTLRNAALVQQTGGGNGFSFSRLRQKGAFVKSSGGTSSGPVGFLKVYDQAFGMVAQGGTRRGANMAVLRVDHPDIRSFVTCKSDESHITNFNISVGITDEFMRAVKDDRPFSLVAPHTGQVVEEVRARELWEMIVRHAHHNGEPGVLFLDAANRSNPVPHLYDLEATNPCGEQWLGPFENCCLGSVNLATHLGPEGQVDWEGLAATVRLSARFLDNVVSANAYVPSVPQLKEAALRCRRIGLGIMGLADLMYHCRVRYGSDEGEEFAAQVMEWVRFWAMETSACLAVERGSFPALPGSIFDPNGSPASTSPNKLGNGSGMVWQPPVPLVPFRRNFGRPSVDWAGLRERIARDGIRNAAQTTVAPTGTIATVAGCEGYGCEPVFALAYTRHVNDNGRDLQLQYVSPLFLQALQKAGLDESAQQRVIQRVLSEGTCQSLKADLPSHVRQAFVVSMDITAEEHVRMQGAIQAFVDNSMSKTCNLPEGASREDVARAYQMAWELGCKGLTVYVTGSRQVVVLETKKEAEKKQQQQQQQQQQEASENAPRKNEVAVPDPSLPSPPTKKLESVANALLKKGKAAAAIPENFGVGGSMDASDLDEGSDSSSNNGDCSDNGEKNDDDEESPNPSPSSSSLGSPSAAPAMFPISLREGKKVRPRYLQGGTFLTDTPVGKAFVTVNEADGDPFECFVNTAKAGSETAAVSEAIGRLISYVLRIESPIEPRERLECLRQQLDGIGGRRSRGFGRNRVCSLPDGVAKALAGYLALAPHRDVDLRTTRLRPLPHPLHPHPPPPQSDSNDDLEQHLDYAAGRIGDLCPDCGEAALINEEGCRKCYSCAYSEC